jgi:hypothetical protein
MVRIVSSILLTGLTLFAVLPGVAAGQSNVPPGNSEIDQYLPTVPGSDGDKPLGKGGGDGGNAALSPSVAERLGSAGSAGSVAVSVINNTAPKLPEAAREQGREQAEGGGRNGGVHGSADESIPGAVLEGLSSSEDGGLGILMPILLGTVAGVAAFIMLRRRASTPG